ncbi:metallophosphoesterase [Acidipropionibacterium jensenii]|uniref:metallophosphoesterase n=1 Tax=Acidipropionibacterium jensenii TaxID=1749 RepID=UPI00214C796C
MRWARTTARVAAAGLGIAGLGLGYGVIEAHRFTLRRFTVPVLAPGSAPIRVLHISDLHLLARQHAKLEWVSRLAGLEPDLVVNTGDNFASDDALEPLLGCLAGLLGVPGVFVFGSNDYLKPVFKNPFGYLLHGRSERSEGDLPELDFEALRRAFTEAGWLDLNDRSGSLEVAGRRVAFRGTDDAHHQRDHYERVAGPADPQADLNIGVTHAPYRRVLDAMTADGMDLILAGHTHGGQVCLPFKGALITNCDIDPARVKGLSTHRAGGRTAWLHVSAGLGSSPFAPYRTFCQPEASLLTLVARH